MGRLKLVIADQDGTLYPAVSSATTPHPLIAALRRETNAWIRRHLGFTAAQADEAIARLRTTHPNPYVGFGSLGLPVPEGYLAVFDALDPSPYIAPDLALAACLGELEANGCQVHVVTFAGERYSAALQQALGVHSLIRTTQRPIAAPAFCKGDVYARIVAGLGVLAEEVLVVGDNDETDLKPARALGLRAVLAKSGPDQGSPFVAAIAVA